MKNFKLLIFSFLVLLSVSNFCCNAAQSEKGNILTKGYEPGKWTMDIQAAREYAKEHNLPIFLNFTGSDWCVWCQLMEKRVFSKDEFYKKTKDKIVLVWIDFPRNRDLVPDEYRERNRKLADAFGIRGFPTYVILGPDGEELGRLGASRDANVRLFLGQLFRLINKK
ncbi:thioredoxin family protein [Thermotomaculum hydrothermale]|nr:thioredoxin family protein [Thermotomaculum hydrothermale]